jgi:UDP-N-acetylglucosamine--N-acetylmuramyl-(pentapeptide) pyrophosphoryl-undecaprenol N-acetylglucosamine transferase
MIVAGGGTGGHLFPGLAVAEAVACRPRARVLFVGSAYGIEATVVPKTAFPFRALRIHGVRGSGVRGWLTLAFELPTALLAAWREMRSFRADIVLGLGGYASVPVVIAAWLRRVPTVLLEQNAHPGLANRLLARLARRVCASFEESARFFPAGRTVRTGNPVRRLVPGPASAADGNFTVFVFGGSQGAHSINRAALSAVRILHGQVPGLRVIHQTGARDEAWVRGGYAELKIDAEVTPFVDDMGDAYGRADLVVCRAGATTLAELTALGRASILVPYPFAADDHQRANAECLVRQHAALLILDADLSGERLASEILGLARQRERLAAMGRKARELAVPDATERVVEVCCQVMAGRA